MKKIIVYLLVAVMLFTMVGCTAAPEEHKVHKIGVVVYDIYDEQVLSFREYLENYIAASFDVKFLYSANIHNEDEEISFIKSCIAEGCEGIMAFNSYDLEKEVKLCSENKVFFIKPASTVSSADFEKVCSNPYYLGSFGPGEAMEYEAGYKMGEFFAKKNGDEYFILSGGASMGNVMHSMRTQGMLDALLKAYGVKFNEDTKTLSVANQTTVSAGNLKVTVCSGYVTSEPFLSSARECYKNNPAKVVMAALPVGELVNEFASDVQLGIVDCYSSQNSELFANGKLHYLCGKYSSIIGPAFAAMYNALTGYSASFRDNGRAFQVTQGFWTSESKEDFDDKYVLSAGIAVNAYSYSDLLNVVKAYNSDANLLTLKELAEAWDFDSALRRAVKSRSVAQ